MTVDVERPCIFVGCVSTDRHWHFGFPGGYENPADPDGPPIPFTTEPAPGVRDYNGALLAGRGGGAEAERRAEAQFQLRNEEEDQL